MEARLCLYHRILCALLRVRRRQEFRCLLFTVPSALHSPLSLLLSPFSYPPSPIRLLLSSSSLPLLLSSSSLPFFSSILLQEPSTPSTPSDTHGLDIVDDSNALESTPHDELVAMLRKQQQTAQRYKRRFSEVRSGSSCLLT